MTKDGDDRNQRLQAAGVIPNELPEAYQAVIEGLTNFEVDVIIAVKRRLDEAGRVSGVEPGQTGIIP